MRGETEDQVSGWTVDTSRSDLSYRIESNRQISRERFGFMAFIGAVVWFEIQRRLETLNNEAARIQAVQNQSISSDTYSANEVQRKDERGKLDEWRKEVDIDRARAVTRDELRETVKNDARTDKSERIDTSKLWIAVAGIVVTIVLFSAGIWIGRQHTPVNITPDQKTVTSTVTAAG